MRFRTYRHLWPYLLILGTPNIAASIAAETASPDHYRVAAVQQDITPQRPVFLAGYGQNRRATGVADPIYGKLILIDDGRLQIAIATLDSIGLTFPDIERIRARLAERWPGLRLMFSSTHSHATPDVVGLWGESFASSGRDPDYVAHLVSVFDDLTARAYARLQPATLSVASRAVDLDWVENRSEPRLLDPTLSVMRFADLNARTIATLTNYPCHPTVLDGDNTLLSADYLAGFYREMARSEPGIHLFLQGAIGGWVQPIAGSASHHRALAIGADLATASLATLAESTPTTPMPLIYQDAILDLPLDNWGFRALIWLNTLERKIHSGHLRTRVSVLRIGPAAVLTHPGETSPAYSLASRALTTNNITFIAGLTQDAVGYILKPDYFVDPDAYPHASYLTSVSVGDEAGPLLMRTLAQLVCSAGMGEC